MATTPQPDKQPSGTFSVGPLGVQWSLKSGSEVDVTVSVLGIPVDTLTGTLDNKDDSASIADEVNVLGLVTGTLGLQAVYDQPESNGLFLTGALTLAGGTKLGPFKYNILPDLSKITIEPPGPLDVPNG